MKITEALVVLFLVLFCYLFLDKFLFRGELGEICFGPTCGRWRVGIDGKPTVSTRPRRRRRRTAAVTPKDDALVVTRDYGARSADASTRRVTPLPAQGEQFRQERPYICTGKRQR